MFDKIHAARLTALADHLEAAETLKVGRFDFNTVYEDSPCGTAGCALGEAALLWPQDFPSLGMGSLWGDVSRFFGIGGKETEHIFVPFEQDTGRFGGTVLGGDATRYEVAAQIRAFLEVKASEAGEL